MSTVQLREIKHSYGPRRVLDGLNLTAESGRYVVLLGESGCGKTTTLQLIAGLQKPSSGSVLLDGQPIDGVPPRRRDVSMVFQHDALYPHLTVRGSIEFGLRKIVAGKELPRRIEEAAELVGATGLLDRYPDKLSGGELRRASIAKAIARRASVRLMDEPMSALDASVRHELQQDLLNWHRSTSGTTLHVTHDGAEAMRMADDIAVVKGGRIVQLGEPEEIYRRPEHLAVAKAIGWPPMNVIPASVFQGGAASIVGPAPESADSWVVGFRANAIEIVAAGNDQATSAASVNSGLFLDVYVESAQFVDGRIQISGLCGTESILASVQTGDALTVGSPMRWHVDARELHFFSVETEHRIDVESVG